MLEKTAPYLTRFPIRWPSLPDFAPGNAIFAFAYACIKLNVPALHVFDIPFGQTSPLVV